MLFSDESKKSGEMPVMRCDTHQGQLWMQHEEVTTTSEYSLRQSLPVRRAKQMRYALDDKESSQFQMAEHGSATTGGSSSGGSSTTTTNNSSGSKVLQQQTVVPPTVNKRPVNAICERLRNNSALEVDGSDAMSAVRPFDAAVDDDDEDDDDSLPSSAVDSLGANDDTEDGMEVSGFGDDTGSCDNDLMENDVGDATSADEEDVARVADGASDDYGRGDARLQQAQNGSKEGMGCEDDDEDDDDALEDGLGRSVDDEPGDGARVAKKAKMVFEDDFDAKYNNLLAGVQDCFLRNSNCKDVVEAPVTNCERRTRSPSATGTAVVAVAKGNSSLVKTERRNKRKNFKPRNIVYQQYDICEDGDGEFLPDYAGSCWDTSPTLDASRLLSSKDDEEEDEECNSLLDRTASAAAAPPLPLPPSFGAHASKSLSCDTELPEVAGGPHGGSSSAEAADQPLDLSDCASTTKRTLLTSRRTPTPLHLAPPFVSKESDNGDGVRRSPSELEPPLGTVPMDLTVSRGTPPESATVKSAADRSALCDDAMDLSKGPALLRRSSPSFSDGAEPNYATSLTTVPPTASSQSAAVTSNTSVYRHLAAAGRNASLMGAPSMSGLTGISASLLGLHGGDLMSQTATHSSASMKAAAAAAAAHVAALGLAQAVRSREEGHDGATAASAPTAIDESAMKDYAESTMKELLGLYGINDMAESITKDVPLPNFSSVKILENMAPTLGLLPHVPPTSSPLSHPVPQSAVTTVTTTTTCTSSSSSAATATMTTTALPIPLVPSHSRPQAAHSSTSMVSSSGRSSVSTPSTVAPLSSGNSGAAPSSSHSSDDLYESLHSQMVVDSVAKLASLSSNNIIGNPRVILPHNMSTILAVAALQKSKSQGSSSSSTPLTSHMGHHRSKSASLVNPPSAHLLGSRGHHGLSAGAAHLSTSLFKEHGKVSPVDYTRYVKRFSSSTECGHNSCKDLNYREHFHCLDCNSRVFVKKEEMIRHFKWHKKRDESLQHGFLRYSPMDDCSERYPNCAHNRKQTHYHCVKENCDKVYISTSDVQMHANYHRKDSAIIQEGFQRFRATEDCATSYCSFAGQRTTHFHCRRPSCNFTFKNKADMEKHKSYHIKDEQLNKDGFKKFMKHEHCSFENCRFSRVCNHIHCIRPGCTYVLHSSGQLYSHKRKHERRETEMAYRKFKLAQSMMRTLGENQVLALQSFGDEIKASEAFSGQLPMPMIPGAPGGLPVSLTPPSTHGLTPDSTTLSFTDAVQQSFTSALLAAGGSQHLDSALSTHGLVPGADQLGMMDFTAELLKSRMDDSWKKYLSRYTANDPCKVHCEYIYKDHYHCNAENCNLVFRSKDGVREHARNHETQDQVTEAFYTTVDVGQNGSCPPDCPHQGEERHYHCGWHGCREIIMATDKPFRRLDHYKMHDYAQKLNFTKEFSTKDPLSLHFASSIEGIFKRKRGRPPKNRVIEFPVSSGSADFPQAIYTSFKLPKSNNLPMMSLLEKGFPSGSSAMTASGMPSMSKSMMSSMSSMLSPLGYLTQNIVHPKVEMQDGFYVFPEGASCPLPACPLYGKLHYHCAQSRCFYVTERSDILLLHSKDFHENIDIMEGFVFFDRSVDCRLPGCQSNRVNRHFHCTRPNCHYSFVRYSTMSQHDDKHRNAEGGGTGGGGGPVPALCTSVGVTTNSLGCGNSGATYPLKRSPVHQTKMECPSPPTITSPGTQLSEPRTTPSPGSSNGKPTVVKATGTYYPLSAFPQSYRTKEGTKPASSSRATSTSDAATDTEPVPGSNASEPDLTAGRLAAEWQILLESHVAYGADKSCGRPFCKLHNRDHVHCTYCNKAFSKLMQLQPHIQKHLQGAMSPTGTSSRMTNSEDDLSDHRLDDDDDDLGLGGEARRPNDHEETSDDSNCSSGRFPSHLRSSPSTDSTPSSQHLPYSASFLAASTGHPVGGDLFPTFPASVSGALGAQLAVPGNGENHGRVSPLQPPPPPPPPPQQALPQHNGSSGGEFDAEHSSHDSTGGGSGVPSPVDSLDSDLGASPPLLSAGAVSGPVVAGGVGVSRKRMAAVAHDSATSAAVVTAAKIPCLRLLKDEPVPHGYVRYRFNEDCQYSHCGYREHQTHFHCMRKDCGYSFCDKTRFVQHTARHERLDTLMGGDFQQFRANVSCGRPACVYTAPPTAGANKASHFHCFKCDFVCTDTNKVVAHRRQHQKLDTIMAAGFEKFTATQLCGVDGCSHNQRQTHYHCLKCQYAVLGLSQMSAHKYRHLE